MTTPRSFSGTRPSRIDGQGRLVLPRAFRTGLAELAGGEVHWRPAAVGGLLIPAPEVEEEARRIRSLHGDVWYQDEELLEALAEAFADMATLHMDVQGRVTLPEEARGALGTEVRVQGLGRVLRVLPTTSAKRTGKAG